MTCTQAGLCRNSSGSPQGLRPQRVRKKLAEKVRPNCVLGSPGAESISGQGTRRADPPGSGHPFSSSTPPPPTAAAAEVLQSLEGERFRSTALAFLKRQCPNSPSKPRCPRHRLTYPGPLQRVGGQGDEAMEGKLGAAL